MQKHSNMIQEKLRSYRKEKGLSQQQMAEIIVTDTSNYSRKEQGEIRIHDEEWEKSVDALDVPLEDIKENTEKFSIKNENTTFNDNSSNYNQYYRSNALKY